MIQAVEKLTNFLGLGPRIRPGVDPVQGDLLTSLMAIRSYLDCKRGGAVRTIYSRQEEDPTTGEINLRAFTLRVGDQAHRNRAITTQNAIRELLGVGDDRRIQSFLNSLLEVIE